MSIGWVTSGSGGHAVVGLELRMRSRTESRRQQLFDDVIDPSLSYRLRHTAAEMGFEHFTSNPIERTLHCGELVEYVDAITVFLHHAEDSVEMPAGTAQSKSDRRGGGPQLEDLRVWSSSRFRSWNSSPSISPEAYRRSRISTADIVSVRCGAEARIVHTTSNTIATQKTIIIVHPKNPIPFQPFHIICYHLI
jgi:hypothetical protein